MKPDNIYKKDHTIYDLVKNDIPIPEQYQDMDYGDLIDGIRKNEIPVVHLFYFGPDVTINWPGKEPVHNHYEGDWKFFVTLLKENIGKKAETEGLPVYVWGLWNKKNSGSGSTRCRWCGSPIERKTGKSIPFCNDSDCKDQYKKFQYLLRTLVKDGKINEFEKECRLNPYISILEDTRHNSHYLLQGLIKEFEVDNTPLPEISDRCFYVTTDNNVVFADRTCKNCGHLMYGNKQAQFCTDKCRYDYHNKMKKLRH